MRVELSWKLHQTQCECCSLSVLFPVSFRISHYSCTLVTELLPTAELDWMGDIVLQRGVCGGRVAVTDNENVFLCPELHCKGLFAVVCSYFQFQL